jgi:outer membrane murein-binding lipoprotein Lpp
MELSSQNSEPKSNNLNAILQTWEQISVKFQNELTALRQDLQAALSDAEQSKTSLQKLTDLYENALTRIANLETLNDQIGQRMQENDEWNAELQEDNIKLEAEVKVAKAHGFRNTIIAGIGGLVLGFLIPLIIKLLRMFKIIPV